MPSVPNMASGTIPWDPVDMTIPSQKRSWDRFQVAGVGYIHTKGLPSSCFLLRELCSRPPRVREYRGTEGGGRGGARPVGSTRAQEARARGGEPASREGVLLLRLEARVRSRAAARIPGALRRRAVLRGARPGAGEPPGVEGAGRRRCAPTRRAQPVAWRAEPPPPATAPPRPAPPAAPPGRTARYSPLRVPAAGGGARTLAARAGPTRSACGRFPPDPGSRAEEEEDADLPEREESWLLAEREESQEAQFPGLCRAVQVRRDAPWGPPAAGARLPSAGAGQATATREGAARAEAGSEQRETAGGRGLCPRGAWPLWAMDSDRGSQVHRGRAGSSPIIQGGGTREIGESTPSRLSGIGDIVNGHRPVLDIQRLGGSTSVLVDGDFSMNFLTQRAGDVGKRLEPCSKCLEQALALGIAVLAAVTLVSGLRDYCRCLGPVAMTPSCRAWQGMSTGKEGVVQYCVPQATVVTLNTAVSLDQEARDRGRADSLSHQEKSLEQKSSASTVQMGEGTAKMTKVPQLQQRPRWQQGLLDEVRTLGLASRLWEEGLIAGKEPEGPRKKSSHLCFLASQCFCCFCIGQSNT
ncbi:hypothetical protein LEMLEM_LOCUS4371 [Lemmus lemmus]